MIKSFEDMQKLGQSNVDSAMRMFGEWNKNWQAIAAEMGDYTKRSFEEGSATLEKLMASKSVEHAIAFGGKSGRDWCKPTPLRTDDRCPFSVVL